MLYLVPTPIGNLGDITYRAVAVLNDVDLILAEDTRTSGKLLKHYEISTHMKSFHAHNEHSQTPDIVSKLRSGQDVALITDAGTPGISDPGFLLVRACREEEIDVTCLPGATAFVPALAASGIPCDKFYFEGFLPQKKGRQTRWKYLSQLNTTIVVYESPHRLLKAIKEIQSYFPEDRMICVVREISKVYEEYLQGTAQEVLEALSGRKSIKGEIVIVISK